MNGMTFVDMQVKLVSGRFEVGQKVQVLPSGFETRIKDMRIYKDELTERVHLQVLQCNLKMI